jgi:hypothetical protein
MKNRKNILMMMLAAVMISSTLFSGCKKEDDDDDDNNNNNNVPTLLCDGNGSNSYLPIKEGNQWNYTSSTAKVNMGVWTRNGEVYYKLVLPWSGGAAEFTRNDSLGNVYQWFDGVNVKSLYIPANPVQGQVITLPNNIQLTIANTDTTLTAVNDSCTQYKNVLKITETDTDGAYFIDVFYVKGIGRVYSSGITPSLTQKLTSLTLN